MTKKLTKRASKALLHETVEDGQILVAETTIDRWRYIPREYICGVGAENVLPGETQDIVVNPISGSIVYFEPKQFVVSENHALLFVIESILIANRVQLVSPIPAAAFIPMEVPHGVLFSICLLGHTIAVTVRNQSQVSSPFSGAFVGTAYLERK